MVNSSSRKQQQLAEEVNNYLDKYVSNENKREWTPLWAEHYLEREPYFLEADLDQYTVSKIQADIDWISNLNKTDFHKITAPKREIWVKILEFHRDTLHLFKSGHFVTYGNLAIAIGKEKKCALAVAKAHGKLNQIFCLERRPRSWLSSNVKTSGKKIAQNNKLEIRLQRKYGYDDNEEYLKFLDYETRNLDGTPTITLMKRWEMLTSRKRGQKRTRTTSPVVRSRDNKRPSRRSSVNIITSTENQAALPMSIDNDADTVVEDLCSLSRVDSNATNNGINNTQLVINNQEPTELQLLADNYSELELHDEVKDILRRFCLTHMEAEFLKIGAYSPELLSFINENDLDDMGIKELPKRALLLELSTIRKKIENVRPIS
mmetsp:Transcript_16539/g.21548  ORF Transcript_16539/g.21548 Transcript_16539/m.21548 type:complete len:376 (-) Transcript_16539:551-1678(-)